MSRTQIQRIIYGGLIVLTLLAVGTSFLSTDPAIVSTYFLELVVYLLLTAFAIVLSVPLSRGELSLAHMIGIIAFLSVPREVAPAMTVAIFSGGLLGTFALMQLPRSPTGIHQQAADVFTVIAITAQVTLPFFVGSRLYADIFRAPQPLNALAEANAIASTFVPLFLFSFLYVVLYFAIFVLYIETERRESRSLINENVLSIAIILLLPIPFAIIGANVARRDVSLVFFVTTLVGVGLIVLGLFVLNRSQQLLRRQLDEVRSISVATQAMRSSLNMESLLRTTYVQVSQLITAQNFTIAIRSEEDNKLTFPLVIRDGEEIEVRQAANKPDDHSLIEHIMQTRVPLLLTENVQAHAAEIGLQPPRRPVKSWLGVPLVTSGDRTLGAFVVLSYDDVSYNENDLRLLNIVATSAGIALENANLYRQKSSRAEQLATLNQVTTLLSGTLSPDEVLDIVVSSASTISEANAVAVYLQTRENNRPELTMIRHAGLSDTFTVNPPAPVTNDELVYATDEYMKPKALVVRNIEDKNLAVSRIRQRLRDENKRAFIEIPLMISGRNLGVLALYFNQPQNFQDEQIDLIQAFTTQASQAIENARTFTSTDEALEQRVEQLYALAAMGRLLTATMDTQRIYQIVLTYATDATKALHGLIALKNAEGNISIPSQRGYTDDIVDSPEILMQGLTGRALSMAQPLRVTDTRLETGYLPLTPATRSMLIVPIMKRRDIMGIILLEHDKPGHFTEGDTHFIAQLANQAIIAVDNTQLFQRIRETRDNLQTILNAMEDAIILIDATGSVMQANPRVSLLDLEPEYIVGQRVDELLDDPALNFADRLGFSSDFRLLRVLDDIGHEDKTWPTYAPQDYEIHTENFGTRYVQRQIIPVRSEEHQVAGVLMVFYDKTEEKELARQRESFSQMIVHDLRSPLTAVTTSLRLLQELVPAQAEYRQVIDKTTDASRRAIRKVLTRVDSLLDVSKLESGEVMLEREPTSLHGLSRNVYDELHPLAEELEVTIENQVELDLPPVDVDADKVERVILNLVDNALKYSPMNATVVIRNTPVANGFVQLQVIDNGPGVPNEYKQRLFDRFVQVKGRDIVRRGVGLGLAFCKLVAEAHGGKIWVEDNPAGGSIFVLTLPVVDVAELME